MNDPFPPRGPAAAPLVAVGLSWLTILTGVVSLIVWWVTR